MIAAASLDDPSQFQPTLDFFISRAQTRDPMNPDLTKFLNMPVQVPLAGSCSEIWSCLDELTIDGLTPATPSD